MIRSLTNEQMRLADRYTIDELGVPSYMLMERAGRAIADEVEKRAKKLGVNSILAVCGGGNNGGDGFIAARILKNRGYDCLVLCYAERFSPDCERAKNLYTGEIVKEFPDREYEIVIDCLFGTGTTRALEGKNAEIVQKINDSSSFVVAADIPSGLNGANGSVMGVAVKADVTVTIAEYKNGLFLCDGKDHCGEVVKKEIGITPKDGEEFCYLVEESDVKKCFPQRKSNSHKGTYGKAAILAGSTPYSGAALLCANACLRVGAGYTTLCVPSSLFPLFVGNLPEALLVCGGGADRHVFCKDTLASLSSSSAIALGPGCGTEKEIYAIAQYLLENYTGKLVLDADALNALARYGVDALKNKKCDVLLTPHVKEFSRLSSLSTEEILLDPIERAKAFAKEYGVTLLLKSNTCIVTDGKQVALVVNGTPALAKGGSGDVLTGLAVGLLAQGKEVFSAAFASAYLLGKAACLAEQTLSSYAVVASDVIANIGPAIRSLS